MANAIGMSVPGGSIGASSLYNTPSVGNQVAGETEEQRRKRLQQLQASRQLPVGASSIGGMSMGGGYGAAFGTQ